MINIQAIKLKFFILFLLIISFSSYSEELNLEYRSGTLYLNIELGKNEKIYWKHPGDLGIGTTINFENTDNLDEKIILWPWPKFKKLDTNNTVAIYDSKVIIPIYLKPLIPEKEINLKMHVNYLLCSNVCTMKKKNFELTLQPNFYWLKHVSKPIKGNIIVKNDLKFKFKTIVPEENIQIIMVDKKTNKIYFPKKLTKIGEKFYVAIFDLEQFSSKTDNFNIRIYTNFNPNYIKYNVKLSDIFTRVEKTPIFIFLIIGLIGGFILNFMPCVLPVLSMKLYNFVNGYSTSERRKHCLVAIFTILIYFFVIASITVYAKNIGGYFVPGLTLQSPIFVIFVAFLLTILVSAIEGNITISLPGSLINKISYLSSPNKYAETFIVTLVSTILATPCTAPFLGNSITFAISTSTTNIYLIFLFISIGFCMPYIFIIIKPSIVNIFPKPGKWQNFIKKFFGLLILITIGWLIVILNSQIGLIPALLVFIMCILIKYTIDNTIMDFYKIFTVSSIILILLVFPTILKDDDSILSTQKTAHWEPFIPERLENYIIQEQIVLVNITAEWCMNCKFLKHFVLNTKRTSDLLRKYHVTSLTGDITNFNSSIQQYLNQNHASGIPYSVVYGPRAPEGIILPSIFSYKDLEEAINNAW